MKVFWDATEQLYMCFDDNGACIAKLDTDETRAILFAAAPEMLELLREVVDDVPHHDPGDRIQALLDRIDGEEATS